MSVADWALLFAVCSAGAVSPGPSLLFILAMRARHGARLAIVAALGHGLGVGLYALAAVAGVAAVLASMPVLAGMVELIGALYLFWLSWQFWLRLRDDEGPSSQKGEPTQTQPTTIFGMAVNGLLVALFNPKIIFYFAGVVAAVAPIDASALEHFGIALLAACIDGGWYALVSLAGGVFAAFFARRNVQKATALLLAAAAVTLFARGVWG